MSDPTSILTVSQKIKLLPLRLVIFVLWCVDLIDDLPDIIVANSLRLTVVALLVSVFFPGTTANLYVNGAMNDVGYLSGGIAYNIYGSPGSVHSYSDVLGSTTVRKDIPYLQKNIPYPSITARSALITDTKSGKYLFNLNGDIRLAPASTTKLMTALVALDMYEMDEVLVVPGHCTAIESSKIGFSEGEEVEVRALMKGLLIASAGDAACTLANGRMDQQEFIGRMNGKAESLGMKNTYFTNPIGLDGVDGSHYSTAVDLNKLARFSMEADSISGMVRMTGDTVKERQIYNTNRLLWEIPNTVGIKTGTTVAAGEVLIYDYRDADKDLIIVVMGSQDRFSDTRALLNWALGSYSWD